jgi:hypothetical protein
MPLRRTAVTLPRRPVQEQKGEIMQVVKKLSGQPILWLGACLLLSFFLLAYPIYVIRPFRYQGASELALALAIVRFRPAILIALSVAAVLMVLLCWRAAAFQHMAKSSSLPVRRAGGCDRVFIANQYVRIDVSSDRPSHLLSRFGRQAE